MGNCSNCGCNDLGEMKTNEVQYDDRQRNSAKTYGNTPSLSGTANAAQVSSQDKQIIALSFGRFEMLRNVLRV
jgi:hypothetical protein